MEIESIKSEEGEYIRIKVKNYEDMDFYYPCEEIAGMRMCMDADQFHDFYTQLTEFYNENFKK